MYIARVQQKVNGKLYTRVLLRRSVRVGKKVVHHTVANLSHCTPEELAAVEVALRYTSALAALRKVIGDAFDVRQGAAHWRGVAAGRGGTAHRDYSRAG